MERMQDGFELAEEDLRLREARATTWAPVRVGYPDLRVARITDHDILVASPPRGSEDFWSADPRPVEVRKTQAWESS